MDAIQLESKFLRVLIDPDRGANIREIHSSTPSNDSWLFCDPLRRGDGGQDRYDDVWVGGFEELFPNDAPGELDGRVLPDHGELWNSAFEVTSQSSNMVALRRECLTVPSVVHKCVELDSATAAFTLRYRILNCGDERVWFLFKLHPAVRIEPGDRILMPGGRVTPVDGSFSRMLAGPGAWPLGPRLDGGEIDLSVVPARGGLQEFIYISDLPAGWCGLQRARTGESIVFTYPREVLPYCWVFMSYGGWRDYYTVVLEPCTNMPKDLATARQRGSCAFLDPGRALEFSVSVEVRRAGA